MLNSETHLFIIWENALYKKDEIIKEINDKFEIIKMYQIKWTDKFFIKNLSRFYGTSLKNCEGKAKHCGMGEFLLIIFKDEDPKYEQRDTSKGPKQVNINVFDLKSKFREMTGGGHRVHATNNEQETNHDLTLLLNLSIEDFLKNNYSNNFDNNNNSSEVEKISKDLFGNNGWASIEAMFYALNNCTQYAVLRNYEKLPDDIYLDNHNDIDLICTSHEDAAYILNAEKVFVEPYRVHYKTKVNNEDVYLDLRYIGDNYYCKNLEEKILKQRIYNSKGFYTLSQENYFYTLLYHALIHKSKFKEDYKKRLSELMPEYASNCITEDALQILKIWLNENDFDIPKPRDESVFFNLENIEKLNSHEFNMQMLENSDLRKNVLHWYPIKKDSSILQIGYSSIKILEELCNKAQFVTIVVEDIKQKEDILKQISNSNIQVELMENVNLQNSKEKYDYVSLIDFMQVFKNKNIAYQKFDELLKIAKEKCKDTGKILLTAENKFGMKNWTTMSESENIICNRYNTLSKKQIDNLLNKNNLANYKYYYLLPDGKFPNVIFTDKYMPDVENINRNFTYGNKPFENFNQTIAFREIIKEDNSLFDFFANSYFIEIGKTKLEDNDIKFVSYTNIRKEKYKMQTIIYSNKVEKTYINDFSKEHFENIKNNINLMNTIGIKTLDSYEDNKIISKYIQDGKRYDEFLIDFLKKGKTDEFYSKINEYKNKVIEKLNLVSLEDIKGNTIFDKFNISYDEEILKKLNFVKHGLWDLIFQNCFLIDNELYFFDQEWYEENIPAEFIIYRTIAYFGSAHAYIPSKELYKYLSLEKYLPLFEELDNKIQKQIRNNSIWNMHNRTKTGQELMGLYNGLNAELYESKKQNIEELQNLNNEIIKLKNENNELQREKNRLLNSICWKITKPIRWLSRINRRM